MTVAELIEKLKEFPPNLRVGATNSGTDDWQEIDEEDVGVLSILLPPKPPYGFRDEEDVVWL